MPSQADLLARSRALEIIKSSVKSLLDQIHRGEKPVLVIPKRTLSNTIYDLNNKILLLGPEVQQRSFTDVNESKKFMQTILMASIIFEALKNNEYPTIRDLYYRGKHTISFRSITGKKVSENTWDEQRESDSVIRDLEVYLSILREDLLILSKEKGKVVGNMVIRSGDDTIDLGKMGHGAYAIEPTPDLIEFLDLDAEYILVVEKDAVFQQLHRYGFWKKHKAVLITSAGQPDRATRRFVRRLSDEYKLPVYILADSIPAEEVVAVRDSRSGEVAIGPVEELVGKYFSGADREYVKAPLEVLSWDPATGKITWSPISYIYRHKIKDRILKIRTKERGTVKVTKGHSLFVFHDGEVKVVPAKYIRPGDYIVVAKKLPLPQSSHAPSPSIEEASKESTTSLLIVREKVKLKDSVKLLANSETIGWGHPSGGGVHETVEFALSRSKRVIPGGVELDEDLAWLMGLYTAGGCEIGSGFLAFHLDSKNYDRVLKVIRVIGERFNVKPLLMFTTRRDGARVIVASRTLFTFFKELGLVGEQGDKRVPAIIINSAKNVILAYLKGLIDSAGRVNEHEDVVYSTSNPVLARQVFLLLQMLGVTPAVVEDGNAVHVKITRDIRRTPPEVYEYLTSEDAGLREQGRPSTDAVYGLSLTRSIEKQLTKPADGEGVACPVVDGAVFKVKLRDIAEGELLKDLGDHAPVVYGEALLAEVESVEEEEYEGYVYDFAVPTGNSFIGGFGIVYHNSDPYGFYIYSVFKAGSITLSYESERLATPSAKFIGVMMTDIFGDEAFRKILKNKEARRVLEEITPGISGLKPKAPYLSDSERTNFIIKTKTRDLERAVELVGYKVAEICIEDREAKSKIKKKEGLTGYPWFSAPEWIRELCIFFNTLSKLEIEALASKGLKFLADRYIPEKISTGDWID